jgi:hypothetical protein
MSSMDVKRQVGWSLEGTLTPAWTAGTASTAAVAGRLPLPRHAKDARRKRRVQAHGALPVEVVELRHVGLCQRLSVHFTLTLRWTQ